MNVQANMEVFYFQERMASLSRAMDEDLDKAPKGCKG